MTNNELLDLIDEELKRQNAPLDAWLEFIVGKEKGYAPTKAYHNMAKQYNIYSNAYKSRGNYTLYVNILSKDNKKIGVIL